MLRDASQRDGSAEACVLALRCDAPQHEGAVRVAGSLEAPNLRLWETVAGLLSLFPACYLQGTLQPQRVWPLARRYCLGMPARSITAAHLPMSAARRAFNSSGVLALASMPSSA